MPWSKSLASPCPSRGLDGPVRAVPLACRQEVRRYCVNSVTQLDQSLSSVQYGGAPAFPYIREAGGLFIDRIQTGLSHRDRCCLENKNNDLNSW